MKTRVPERAILAAWLAAGTLALPAPAAANERHFTYTYESGVLPRGARELEFWSTYRTGRHDFYSRLDQRAEFEVGLSDHLMTALYLNWRDVATADPTTGKVGSQFSWQGVSSEWKYKLSDPVADRFGSALYGEASFSTRGMELEGKLILDKRAAKNLFAYNLVVEGEWERTSGGLQREEVALENDLGWTHFFRRNVAAGLELRSLTVFTPDHSPRHSALFLGPVVSYGGDHWWVALTAQGQLPALKRSVEDPGERLVLDDLERLNVRLLFSYEW
jgi:hypothetical protein